MSWRVSDSTFPFKYSGDRSNRDFHCQEPSPQGVVVRAWGRNLVDRYINREIGICLHFHTWNVAIKPECRDLVVVFQQTTLENIDLDRGDAGGQTQHRADIGGPRPNDVQLPMAIHSGPIVQDTKTAVEIKDFLALLERRSVARLYAFDEGLKLVREWGDLPTGLLEMPPVGTDGKFKMLFVGGRVLFHLHDGGGVNTTIKSSTELVKHFAQCERELIGEAFVSWTDPNAPCPIGVHVHSGGIAVFLDKAIPHLGEGYAVSVRPFDTLPTAIEW